MQQRMLSLPLALGLFFCLWQATLHWSGVNPVSRMVQVFAWIETQSFQIDPYVEPVEWTHDWARTLDGHYHSNKSPGAAVLALPLYAPIDAFLTRGMPTRAERDAFRQRHLPLIAAGLSFLLQVLPYLALVLWLFRRVVVGNTWFLLTALFGTTASFYFGSFFGHGLGAFFTLASGLALYRAHWSWLGFCVGWAMLADYSAVFLLPGLMVGIWIRSQPIASPNPANPQISPIFARAKFLRSIFFPLALGALLPAVLWVAYHTTYFGSPLRLPNAFQNPIFIDRAEHKFNLWGVFVPIPDPIVVLELLFGDKRGLLKTQPWWLLFLGLLLLRGTQSLRIQLRRLKQPSRALVAYALGAFVGVFYMNACFGSWDGGIAPGPRYQALVFPLCAFAVASVWSVFDLKWRRLFWCGTWIAVAYLGYYWLWRTESDFFTQNLLIPLEVAKLWQGSWVGLLLVVIAWSNWFFCKTKKGADFVQSNKGIPKG